MLSKGENDLISAIIQQALHDYCRPKPKSKKSLTTWEKDKNSAELFFKKSRLFKLTGLSFEYLVEKYKSCQNDDL